MMKKIIFVIVLLLLGGLGAYWGGWIPRAQKSHEENSAGAARDFLQKRSESFYRAKHYSPLVAVYERMIRRFPDKPDLKKKLAASYFGIGDYEKASPLLEEIVAGPAADAETFYELAFIAQERGEKEKARERLGKALLLDPRHPRALKLKMSLK